MRDWLLVLCLMSLLGCGAGDDSGDPCAGATLPACPEACPDDWAGTCGQPCDVEGEACGSDIGDGRVCQGGAWVCSVHAPQEPYGCDLVCQ